MNVFDMTRRLFVKTTGLAGLGGQIEVVPRVDAGFVLGVKRHHVRQRARTLLGSPRDGLAHDLARLLQFLL